MKFLLIPLFVIMIIFVTPAYGMPPPPPTDFTVTIMDETNSKINLPAYLHVTEILNGKTLETYQLDLFENPQSISIDWAVPSRDVNTEIHIVAIKQGFEDSDEFIFKITNQTPQEGTLFEHDFVLKTEETSKVIDKKFDITFNDKSYSVESKSSSTVESIDFIESEKSLLVVVNEDSSQGFTELTFLKSLIESPYRVLLDDVTVFPTETKSGQSITLNFQYTNGIHSIRIISDALSEIEQEIETDSTSVLLQDDKEETIETKPDNESTEEGGGCLIATATYGSEMSPQVQQLRELRDNQLLNTESGTAFMSTFNDIYYSFSPIIADYERENPLFKEAIKLGLTPMLSSLAIMENAESESEVLGLGLSVIALNLGMYIGLPAFGIVKLIQIRKN
jgi:hypothetical protein